VPEPPYATFLLKNNVNPFTQLIAPLELQVATPPADELNYEPQVALQFVKVVPVEAAG